MPMARSVPQPVQEYLDRQIAPKVNDFVPLFHVVAPRLIGFISHITILGAQLQLFNILPLHGPDANTVQS
jgi:hypothetical protein